MTAQKYARYIISEPKSYSEESQSGISTIESTHLMTVDSEVVEDMFYADGVWLWKGTSDEKAGDPHIHDFDEVIAFIGSDQENPQDLCGEITIWLDGEKHVIDKTCLIFVPTGAVHCPIVFNRIDKPVFHFATGQGTNYTGTEQEK